MRPGPLHFLVLALILAQAVNAANYYVSPSGNDNNPGTSAQPWKTINKAVLTLVAGDTAYVAAGTYDISQGPGAINTNIGTSTSPVYEYVVSTASAGTSSAPIRLIAQSTATNIIGRGNSPAAQDDARQVFLTKGGIYVTKGYWQLEGFYIRDRGLLRLVGAPHVTLKNNLYFVDPGSTNGRTFGGGYMLIVRSHSDYYALEGNEFWSINFDGHRELARNDPRETESSLVTVSDSDFGTVKNNFFYGGRDLLGLGPSADGFVVENNQLFYGQEHIGGPSDSSDWVYRYNVFASKSDWVANGGGQQSIYVKSSCDIPTNTFSYSRNGQIYNNLGLGISMATLRSLDSTTPCPASLNGIQNIRMRNNVAVRYEQRDTCYSIEPGVTNALDSDYNLCISKLANGAYPFNFFSIYTPDIRYSLAEWRLQTQFPQPEREGHSYEYGPSNQGVQTVLGYGTPLAALGNLENDAFDCSISFGSEYSGVHSNCQPPFRMRILDDLRHVDASSVMRDAGDPAFGSSFPGGRVDLGPFEYSGSAPPQTCSDGTDYGQCSQEKPKYCLSGVLVDQCATCGCPSGQECDVQSGSCSLPVQTCTDGTPYGQCSQTQPLLCQNGILVNSCVSCGCPSGQTCNSQTGSCSVPVQTCSDGTAYGQCSLTQPLYCQNGVLLDACSNCGCPSGQSCDGPSGSCSVENVPPVSGDGYLWMEAEGYRARSGAWVNVNNDLASGGMAVMTGEGSGNDVGQLNYSFALENDGTYYVWARTNASSTVSDSIYVSVDGVSSYRFDFPRLGGWYWDLADNVLGVKTFDLSAGTHVFTVTNREDGTALDKFLLTADASFVPTGFGGAIPTPTPTPSTPPGGSGGSGGGFGGSGSGSGSGSSGSGGGSSGSGTQNGPSPTRGPVPTPADAELTPTPFAFLPVSNSEIERTASDLPSDAQSQELHQLIQNAKSLESQGRFAEAAQLWTVARTRLNDLILRSRQSKAASYYWIGGLFAVVIVAGAVYLSTRQLPPQDPPILIKPETFLESVSQ